MKPSNINIPNLLTITRIVLAPLVFVALYNGGGWMIIAAILFLFGSMTDWLDGYFARRNQQVTGFGQFADPVADKLLSGFALVGVTVAGFANLWPVIGIIFRDVLITSFRLWAMDRGRKILPSKLAKLKTALEMLTIVMIMIYAAIGGETSGFRLGTAGLVIVCALAWITCIDYFWKNRAIIG